MAPDGQGTEQVEKVVCDAFSDLRVGRLDADTARGSGLLQTLDAFRAHELDLLVGTQMVTKGHDFPNVTLVGVLSADQSLRFPDFRSGERTFQLLTQVAGRAGRGARPGRVMMQTWNPVHPILQAVVRGDWDAFVTNELRFRRRLLYPPFGHAVAIRLDGPQHEVVHAMATQLLAPLSQLEAEGLRIAGPVDAPIGRIRERYRVQALLRAPSRALVQQAARLVRWQAGELDRTMRHGDIRLAIDIDPQALL